MTKRNKNHVQSNEFIYTIEDDENNVLNLESEDEEIDAGKSVVKKSSKKSNDIDIDPEFQFDLEENQAVQFSGWDFTAGGDDEAKESENSRPKGVDLDEIIRRKGGLEKTRDEEKTGDEETRDEETFDERDNSEADEEDDSSEEQDEESDEDTKENGKADSVKDTKKRSKNSTAESLESGEDTKENEDESDDNTADDGTTEPVDQDSDDSSSDIEADTAEQIAEFYAPSTEAEDAKKSIHTTFQTLSLSRPVFRGLADLGYSKPSPVQSAVIPIALLGKDIVAGAVTGSGKTAAYLIPIIERLLYRPKKVACTRVIVLAPTRELAIQVCDVGRKLAKHVPGLRFGLAVGGLSLKAQEQELKARPDIVIATPGRFIDHVRNSPSFQVDDAEILVVDEADRMLEEGFQKELNEILSLIPSKRQTLLFSATMNNKIKDLIHLSLHKPVRILIDPPKQTAGGLVQEFIRIREKRESMRPAALISLIKKMDLNQRIIVFVSRKETAHRLRIIMGLLGIKIGELHGSLSQEQRLTSITDFKNLSVPILICTDLASRGLDIPKIEIVINYDMPKTYEIYLHRVGRTARAGRQGRSISFIGESAVDRGIVRTVMKNTNPGKNKILSRNLDWTEVESIHNNIETKEEIIQEILAEEKQEKLLAQAERDVKRGENLIKYENEIKSRPKRTWFEAESEKVSESQLMKQKKKKIQKKDDEDNVRIYKKTQKDRQENQKRGNRRPGKSNGKKGGKVGGKKGGKKR